MQSVITIANTITVDNLDHSDPAYETSAALKKLGTISCEVFRSKSSGKSKGEKSYELQELPAERLQLAEKKLKGDSLSHSTMSVACILRESNTDLCCSLGESSMLGVRTVHNISYVEPRTPIAVFIFKYRSEGEMLRVNRKFVVADNRSQRTLKGSW